ncbi:hypothetical protein BJX70DRAFT_359971, partial [Aspergillus crustosus]
TVLHNLHEENLQSQSRLLLILLALQNSGSSRNSDRNSRFSGIESPGQLQNPGMAVSAALTIVIWCTFLKPFQKKVTQCIWILFGCGIRSIVRARELGELRSTLCVAD